MAFGNLLSPDAAKNAETNFAGKALKDLNAQIVNEQTITVKSQIDAQTYNATKHFQNISEIIVGYRLKIGVMGSASGSVMRNKKAVKASRVVGAEIAKHGCTLVNGACPGLPDEAALGCKNSGGKCLGISPAISVISHINRYKSPIEHYDEFIFTGLGLMMRDIINVRSCDGVIILPGGTGTLNEFTVAYDEGKPIGILTGHGGCADHIDEILEFCKREPGGKNGFLRRSC